MERGENDDSSTLMSRNSIKNLHSLAMDYRRVRTSEGVLDEVYFFVCFGYVRNI